MLSIFKGFLLKVFFSIYSMFYEHNYSSLILYLVWVFQIMNWKYQSLS